MTAQAEFWAQKRRRPEYHCMTFNHPAWTVPFRLVINQYSNVTLNSDVYLATTAQLNPPAQDTDSASSASISFPRSVVGREFKQALKQVVAYGIAQPITATYGHFIYGTTLPVKSQRLWISENGGVSWNGGSVSIKCSDNNPLRRDVSSIYDVDIFTGLKTL